MLRALRVVTFETFTLLRRDRIFAPALVASVLVAAFAVLASDWSIEDFSKILYDIGFFGFELTGSLVALFWGSKVVGDSRQEGSLEVQLAAPVGRGVWLVGKFLGLTLALLLLGLVLLVVWQLGTLAAGFGRMTEMQLIVFAYMVLGWVVLAALALLLSTLMRPALALFSSVALWLAGMATSAVAATLSSDTSAAAKKIVAFLARYWDLGQFNLVDHALDQVRLSSRELAYRGGYGILLIFVLLTVACLFFQRRDATA